MDSLVKEYVSLVLGLGRHDPDYVDAYYGPPEWKGAIAIEKPTVGAVRQRAARLAEQLAASVPPASAPEDVRLRHQYLTGQVRALAARAAIVAGDVMPFDEESRLLYDAVAPPFDAAEAARLRAELDTLLPGAGSLQERYTAYQERFAIPKEKLDAVFTAAIGECRARTLKHITLPAGERFTVEYVTDKSWSGYNWYKGQYHSVIQVNTDLPVLIDRALDLACHEGYPGHHVYNVLLEQHLLRERGWQEFSIYPLFSPQSLIAEGTANAGIAVAFTPAERLDFERRVLYPLAGLDPSEAERYLTVVTRMQRLAWAGNEAARQHLDGTIDEKAAAEFLHREALSALPRAEQRVRFYQQYRSYVINYNVGQALVEAYVDRLGGTDRDRRWTVFADLLRSPKLPSALRAGVH